jgi:hypothetical protein
MNAIPNFDAYLGQLEVMMQDVINIYNTTTQQIKEQPNGMPYDDDEYHRKMDAIDLHEATASSLAPRLIDTKNRIDILLGKLNNVNSSFEQMRKTLNNTKLSSGLQGLIKRQIRSQPNATQIINSLPESVGDTLRDDEYPSVPYNKNAGKSKMKKFRKRTHKKRTLKKGKRR